MNQPLLFDLSVSPQIPSVDANLGGAPSNPLVPVSTPSIVPVTTSGAEETNRIKNGPEVEPVGVIGSDEPGLNHMGDLARLVLLRYDLVAARRARRRARMQAGLSS